MFRRLLYAALTALALTFAAARAPAARAQGAAPAAREVQATALTMKEAEAAFTIMAGQKDIAFGYAPDGCYARAHLMAQRLQAVNVRTIKVWAFQDGDPLVVNTELFGTVRWVYHVAPAVVVQDGAGGQRAYVLDPALFDRPVTVSVWRARMKGPGATSQPFVTWTNLGEAPVGPGGKVYGGTGYGPCPGPAAGADADAKAVMAKYRRKLAEAKAAKARALTGVPLPNARAG